MSEKQEPVVASPLDVRELATSSLIGEYVRLVAFEPSLTGRALFGDEGQYLGHVWEELPHAKHVIARADALRAEIDRRVPISRCAKGHWWVQDHKTGWSECLRCEEQQGPNGETSP